MGAKQLIIMKLLLLLVAAFFSSASFAQNTPQEKLDSFSAKFVTAIRTHEQQRIFMATDKSIYRNGESIWFKAFLVNTISGKINSSSRFLFVDLVNDRDVVIKTLILDAANKQTDSKIILPSTLPSGNYWLRAYTRHILATDLNNICVKPVYVFNSNDDLRFKTLSEKVNNPDSLVIKFYPEGGNIITGASSTVAVRATDLAGNPVAVKGLIRDNYDAVMAGFTTDEYGLGKFDFEPSGHRQYRGVINYNGRERNYPLPAFNFFGGQISITEGSPDYLARVLLGDSIYTKTTLTYLIAIAKDNMVFGSIGRGLYQVSVPANKLPDGIVTFYLFDEGFKLLSERSVYVDDNSLHVKLSTDKKVYAPHEKVTLNFSVTGGDNQPVSSLVAISAIDTAFSDPAKICPMLPTDYSDKTIDNIFLAKDECLSDKAKDILMMMRNNNYENLSKSIQNPAGIDNDSLLYIKGLVLNKQNQPAAGKVVTLISNSGNIIFRSDTSNAEGRFRFPLENYADSTQFGIELKNVKGKADYKIILDTFVFPKVKTPFRLKEFVTVNKNKLEKYISYHYGSNQQDKMEFNRVEFKPPTALPNINLKDQKLENYIISKRVSLNSAILTSKEMNERTSVGDAVLGVGGLHLLNGYLVINGLTQMAAPNSHSEPMIVVNGVPVTPSPDVVQTSPDLAYLNSFNPKSIDFIEILKGADGARYGIRGGNGVILVTTKNIPTEDATSKKDNLQTFYATGISRPSLFPITTYPENEQAPAFNDDHATLFWNGNYFTDKPDNAISFYTGEVPATYKVTMSGITSRGDIIYRTTTFKTQ
jgi:TonB-dependent SusC/RagA subfamily outer membrane receptor